LHAVMFDETCFLRGFGRQTKEKRIQTCFFSEQTWVNRTRYILSYFAVIVALYIILKRVGGERDQGRINEIPVCKLIARPVTNAQLPVIVAALRPSHTCARCLCVRHALSADWQRLLSHAESGNEACCTYARGWGCKEGRKRHKEKCTLVSATLSWCATRHTTTILISETRWNVHYDIMCNLCNEMYACNVFAFTPEGISCTEIKTDLNMPC